MFNFIIVVCEVHNCYFIMSEKGTRKSKRKQRAISLISPPASSKNKIMLLPFRKRVNRKSEKKFPFYTLLYLLSNLNNVKAPPASGFQERKKELNIGNVAPVDKH
jgi:hypothetical protein